MSHRNRIRLVVGLVFVVGLALRAHHLGEYPARNATADEYAWTWSGMTLLGEGAPRAWSWLPGYPSFPVVQWRGNPYRIVKPWLDHPPLYPLYVGAFMRAAGVRDIFAVELATMRASTLLAWSAAFFLFFACARRVADEPTALLALAFWAVAPPAVWNGRLVMAEQLMVPLGFAGHLALLRFADDGRRRWLGLLALVAALLPLTKAAAALALWLFTLAVLRRSRPAALAVVAGGALGLAFYALAFNQRIVTAPFMYLPFLLGLLTLVADLRESRHLELGLYGAVYAAGIAFFLPYNEYGWYAIPLYPVLAFGLASFVVRAYRDAAPAAGWIWLLFSGTYLCWIACDARLGRPALWRWIYLAAAVTLPVVALAAARAPRRWRAGFALLVAAQLCADGWYALGR